VTSSHHVRTLLECDLATLQAEARAVRTAAFGTRVTFSPTVVVPLAMPYDHHENGTCTGDAVAVAGPDLDAVVDIARSGWRAGCHGAVVTLGEHPGVRFPVTRPRLTDRDRDRAPMIDSMVAVCRAILDDVGLLPHADGGALSFEELIRLREVTTGQSMLLESLAHGPAAHRSPSPSPSDKTSERYLATLEAAGRAAVPFSIGLPVGADTTRQDRIDALGAIAASHGRFGHVQEVIVRTLPATPGTATHRPAACPPDELEWTIAVARLLLPPDVHLQAPADLSDDLASLLASGIDDWGGVSPMTTDNIGPALAWPAIEILRAATEAAGHTLAPRLAVYPRAALDPERWLAPPLRFPVLDASDAEGLARDHPWCTGGDVPPPDLLTRPPAAPPASSGSPVREVLAGVAAGQQVGEEEIVTLFAARGAEVRAVAALADQLRRETVGDEVTFVVNRNINYTNVCTFKCRFCAFSKGPRSLNLRGAPYLMKLEEITDRVREAEACGATEVCLQGGIHPDFDGDYYLDVVGAVRRASETMHMHGFSALEVSEGARRSRVSLSEYLTRLRDAGLKTLPGTAAEILDDDVRKLLCPDKIDTDRWLDVHRTAHRVGLRSNVTIMFGAVEHPRSWARHLTRTRALQMETGGFTEFVPLPFVHMATPIYLRHRSRRGPTFRETVLMHAIGRIAYAGHIDNIQVSWVKLGADGVRQILRAGANDLGGTLMEENIARAAGASHGRLMDESDFASLVGPIGRTLAQRTTLYGRVPETAMGQG
jgi:FO synthase